MKLIVGLGNPGKEYEFTRHNAGFLAVDSLAPFFKTEAFHAQKKLHGEVAKGKLGRSVVLLLKPSTFMNNSGEAVVAALSFYKLKPQDVLVIHDDKDFALGELRLQANRGSAGHNGIKSIIEKLGTQDFARLRIGVAPEDRDIASTADFVLGSFTANERKQLTNVFSNVATTVQSWLAS